MAELAYHWAQATAPEDLDKAVHYAEAAGDEALARLAPDEALRWYGQAVALLEQRPSGPEEQRCRLLVGLGNTQRQTGNPAWRQTLLDAAHLAQDLGATELLVAAALANNRGIFSVMGVVDAERVAVARGRLPDHTRRHRFRRAGPAPGAARLRESHLVPTPRPAESRIGSPSFGHRPPKRGSGDPGPGGERHSDFHQRAGRPIRRHRALCPKLPPRPPTVSAIRFFSSGMRSRCACTATRPARSSRATRSSPGFGPLLTVSANRCFGCRRLESATERATTGASDFDEAERQAVQAAARSVARSESRTSHRSIFAEIGVIRLMQGRSDEIVDLAVQAAAENPGVPYVLPLPRHDLLRSRPPRRCPVHVLEPFVADDFASFPRDVIWLTAMYIASYVLSELHWVGTGRGPVQERVRPFAGQIACVGAACWESLSYPLGLLAATLDRYDDAEAYFSMSVVAHEAESEQRGG